MSDTQRPSNPHLSPPTEFQRGRYGWPDLFWATGDMPYNQAMAWCEHHRSRAEHFERMLQLRPADEPAAVPGVEPWQVSLWDSINSYVEACGGNPGRPPSPQRMDSVAAVNAIVRFEIKRTSEPPAETRESGWLVENGKRNERRAYRMMDPCGISIWTDDPNKALRFARRVDAEQFCAGDEGAWGVVEHVFVKPSETKSGPTCGHPNWNEEGVCPACKDWRALHAGKKPGARAKSPCTCLSFQCAPEQLADDRYCKRPHETGDGR